MNSANHQAPGEIISLLSSDDEEEEAKNENINTCNNFPVKVEKAMMIEHQQQSSAEQKRNMDKLKSQCWKCHVSFEPEKAGELCCYLMHTHPLFQVPICSYCAENVAAVEAQLYAGNVVNSDNNDEENIDGSRNEGTQDACSGCGTHEDDLDDVLWLCDSCPRATCSPCVTQANGGIPIDPESDENAEWNCPFCKPPTPLSELRIHMEKLTSSSPSSPTNRSKQDMLNDLSVVEDKKKDCEKYDQPDFLNKLRDDIRHELRQKQLERTNDDDGDIDDDVEAELSLLRKLNEMQEHRLSDYVSSLQDEIETSYPDYDLKEFYIQNGESIQGDGIEEPEWKIEADKELTRRERKQDQRPFQADPFNPMDVEERYIDVEDLDVEYNSENEGTHEEEASQWRSSRTKPTKSMIDWALKHEEEAIARENIRISAHVGDKDDADAILQEEHEISRQTTGSGSSRISRIRRDDFVQQARLRQGRKRRSTYQKNASSTRKSRSNEKQTPTAASAKALHRTELPHRPLNNKNNVLEGRSTEKFNAHSHDIEEDKNSFFEDHIRVMPPAIRESAIFRKDNPSFVLSGGEKTNGSSAKQRTISIAEPLTKILKAHQKQGIRFMFRNTFADLAFEDDVDVMKAKADIGGCILAHHMGLGKSLSCVALLHAMFHHPSLKSVDENNRRRGVINTVLLVVPVNTLANWDAEFDKWTGKLNPSIVVHNLYGIESHYRMSVIAKWAYKGGVLLVSDQTYRNIVMKGDADLIKLLQSPGPDVVVLDEAHMMLKNTSNKGFQVLNGIRTSRRICLTGSPFQNNLLEYFRMVSYVRPGVLGTSERIFKRDIEEPVLNGLASDASVDVKERADEILNQVERKVQPFVDRKDAHVLRKDLHPMQEVVLYVRQTKIQGRLYGAFKKYQRKNVDNNYHNNFLQSYHHMRPVHNHPACLITRTSSDSTSAIGCDKNNKGTIGMTIAKTSIAQTPSSLRNTTKEPQLVFSFLSSSKTTGDSRDPPVASTKIENSIGTAKVKDEFLPRLDNSVVIDLLSDSEPDCEDDGYTSGIIEAKETISTTTESTQGEVKKEHWWTPVAERYGVDKLKGVESGNKLVLLLHIVVQACILDEKVVVFSQCLKTLDFLEEVLALKDWSMHVPSLTSLSTEHQTFGGWRSGQEYLRIDGGTSGAERGDLVKEFSKDSIRLFLISLKAGGIGINLCSASRVILFDSTFNPAVTDQATFRCYRYGQERDVFTYRFITQGTVEEKVYSRCVNKANLGNRVVDGKAFRRCFTKGEVEDLEKLDTWVQCDSCNKWRMLPPWANINQADLPEKWYCDMNAGDERHNNCEEPDKDETWYRHYFDKLQREAADAIGLDVSSLAAPFAATEAGKAASIVSREDTERLVARDKILQNLIQVSSAQKSKIVSKFNFHQLFLGEAEDKKIKIQKSSNSSNATVEDSGNKVSSNKLSTEQVELSSRVEWIICDKCYKRRMMPPWINLEKSSLPKKWYCKMNIWDKEHNKCEAIELDMVGYAKHFKKIRKEGKATNGKVSRPQKRARELITAIDLSGHSEDESSMDKLQSSEIPKTGKNYEMTPPSRTVDSEARNGKTTDSPRKKRTSLLQVGNIGDDMKSNRSSSLSPSSELSSDSGTNDCKAGMAPHTNNNISPRAKATARAPKASKGNNSRSQRLKRRKVLRRGTPTSLSLSGRKGLASTDDNVRK